MTALKITAVPDDEPNLPTAEVYVVTPAVAKRWLARNVRNRRVGQADVDKYARDMTAGKWQITGEAIKFDTNGALSDGQHRLQAVIKSGVSVPMLIVRGVAPGAQEVMDSGRKRSVSDSLTLNGIKNSSILQAAARTALKEPAAGFVSESERRQVPSNSEVIDFVNDHPEIHRAAEMASMFYPAFDCPPSILTLAWMRLAIIDMEAAAVFFHSIANMQTAGPGDPRLALIRRLANARRDKTRLSQRDYISLILRTWNAWRTGRSVNKFQTETRGEFVKTPGRLH